MGLVRVDAFTVSVDGYGAGPGQCLEAPMGRGGGDLHPWMLPTRTFRAMSGKEGGTTGVDDDFAARSMANLGAWVMGRHMFAPANAPWPDQAWRGWWGEEPPYHCPVFVLTHRPRPPLAMRGGTVFHFVADGAEAALARAREAAGALDVRIGGGVSTVREYLRMGVIDRMHLVVSPVLLGSGESLFDGIDLVGLGYAVTEQVASPAAMHVVVGRM